MVLLSRSIVALVAAMMLPAADALAADDLAPLVALYRDLHRAPELSLHEEATAARLSREIDGLGFEVTAKVGGHGVVAVLKNGPGPVLMIRTDMDALPIEEATGLPYASVARGPAAGGGEVAVMHACGHDIHMAAWVGVARQMAAGRAEWSGTLVMIAQPAEEIVAGARAMLADGLYTRFPRPTHVLGLHDSAALPTGSIGWTSGYAMADVDSVDMVVRGVGGHGAMPHLTRDPVVLAARIVLGLQTIVSREVDPQEAAVITVGAIEGGTKHNIISDAVRLKITVRVFGDIARKRLLDAIERTARGEAIAMGLPADRMPQITVSGERAPAVFNSEDFSAKIASVFVARFGTDRVVALKPSMASEDFSEYGRADRRVQSMLFWVGAQPKAAWDAAGGDLTKLPSLHSARFAPDAEPTIATAVEAMGAAAMAVLARPADGTGTR